MSASTLSRRQFVATAGAVGAASILVGLTGCSSSSSDSSSDSSEDAVEVKSRSVGTQGTAAPYTYYDDDNNLTGFDVEVVRAIDEKLEGYEFDFTTLEWSSMFTALDAEKIVTIANEVASTDERQEKYYFCETPYAWCPNAIVFRAGLDIKTIEDLHGLTVEGEPSSINITWLEEYNAENGDPISITYTDADSASIFQDILNERCDATLISPVTANYIIEEQGLTDLEWVLWTDSGITPVYFFFAQTDEGEELAGLFDEAVNELLDDGTIAALSEEFLGGDYSTEEAILEQVEALEE